MKLRTLLALTLILPTSVFASVISDYTGATNDYIQLVNSTKYDGTSFPVTGSNYDLDTVTGKFWREGTPGTITIELKETSSGLPTGSVLSSGTFNANSITTSSTGENVAITMSAYELVDGTNYAFYIKCPSCSGTDRIKMNMSSTGGSTGNSWVDSTDSGSTWSIPDANYIFYYSIDGTAVGGGDPPVDIGTSTASTTPYANIEFGLGVIITLLSLGLTGFIWNSFNTKRKPWQK